MAAGAIGFGTAVLTRTTLGAVVALCVLGVLRWPRARIALRLLPAVVMVFIGFYVAWGQFRHNYAANFEWPTYFEPARNLSWLVVIFLAADVVVGRVLKDDLSTKRKAPVGSTGPLRTADAARDVPVYRGQGGDPG